MWQIFPTTVSPSTSVAVQRGKAQRLLESANNRFLVGRLGSGGTCALDLSPLCRTRLGAVGEGGARSPGKEKQVVDERCGSSDRRQAILARALYLMLRNPTYLGEIVHKEQSHPGEHTPIIDHPLWDAVQMRLAGNTAERNSGTDTHQPSLLAGMLFDAEGNRMTPSYADKQSTRYR